MKLQDFLCMIGLHKWGKWSKAHYGKYYGTNKTYYSQTRECDCCERHDTKVKSYRENIF